MNTPPLETSRLRLRQWRAEDFAPFAAMNADPYVMAHFPAPLGRAESDALAERCLNRPMAELPFSPCIEIGWRLARPFWQHGYASEAARAALAFAFDTLGLDEIVSFTSLGNQRSQAVMARLGMQRASEHFQHPALPIGHALREHCLYRLARSDWRAT